MPDPQCWSRASASMAPAGAGRHLKVKLEGLRPQLVQRATAVAAIAEDEALVCRPRWERSHRTIEVEPIAPVGDPVDMRPGAVRTVCRRELKALVDRRVLDDLGDLKRAGMFILKPGRTDENAAVVAPCIPGKPHRAN
jgi:hypothetical protein